MFKIHKKWVSLNNAAAYSIKKMTVLYISVRKVTDFVDGHYLYEYKGEVHWINMAKNNRILIVDDDKSNLMILMDTLQEDYHIYIARNGREALKNATAQIPDLILLDIILPDIDGYEVLATLRQADATKEIPVIFTTGLNESGSREKGLMLGAADYISKPFSPSEVKQKVAHHIAIINQQRP